MRQTLLLACACVLAFPPDGPGQQPSRAAWWLAQDGVKPLADLVNTAEPGKGVKFADRVGKFAVATEGESALIISGEFPEANIWRFDLTTFDKQFDMRTLY